MAAIGVGVDADDRGDRLGREPGQEAAEGVEVAHPGGAVGVEADGAVDLVEHGGEQVDVGVGLDAHGLADLGLAVAGVDEHDPAATGLDLGQAADRVGDRRGTSPC